MSAEATPESDERNDYDSAARLLVRSEPMLLLAWLLGEPVVEVDFAERW